MISKEMEEVLSGKREWWVETGDSLSVLKTMPSKSVHLIVTSPPYYGLRSYKAGSLEIGREDSPERYIEHLVKVCEEAKRVLRDDGTFWLNIGDSYVKKRLLGIPWRVALSLQESGWILRSDVLWTKTSPMPGSQNGWRWERCMIRIKKAKRGSEKFRAGAHPSPQCDHDNNGFSRNEYALCPGCDKCSETEGYVLRKGSWRVTTAHEYIFMFSKTDTYYGDRYGVRQKLAASTVERDRYTRVVEDADEEQYAVKHNHEYVGDPEEGANLRSWLIFKNEYYKGDHYAVFPTDLPAVAIKCGTGDRGVCPRCGNHMTRVLDNDGAHYTQWKPGSQVKQAMIDGKRTQGDGLVGKGVVKDYKTVGWQPSCKCKEASKPVPAIVLDIFSGSGTTGRACQLTTRHFIGIELNKKSADDSRLRLRTRGKSINKPPAPTESGKKALGFNVEEVSSKIKGAIK